MLRTGLRRISELRHLVRGARDTVFLMLVVTSVLHRVDSVGISHGTRAAIALTLIASTTAGYFWQRVYPAEVCFRLTPPLIIYVVINMILAVPVGRVLHSFLGDSFVIGIVTGVLLCEALARSSSQSEVERLVAEQGAADR